jgi:hypothetical protein
MSRPTKVARPTSAGGDTAQIQMTCAVVGAVRPRSTSASCGRLCIFDPSLLLGDQALHELGPFLLVPPRHLRVAASRRLGFGWSSLCNRVAQTCGSVPCSTQEPMPAMKVALAAARIRQGPITNRAWQAFTHTVILGEHKANFNSPGTLRVFRSGMPCWRS